MKTKWHSKGIKYSYSQVEGYYRQGELSMKGNWYDSEA